MKYIIENPTAAQSRRAFCDLLKECPPAGKDLHCAFGLDFNADYTAAKISTPATVKRALAAVGDPNPRGTAVIIVFSPKGHRPQNEWFNTVSLDKYGTVDIEVKTTYHSAPSIDYFYAKTRFEEYRKEPGTAYIIAQERQLLKPWKNPAEELDHAERYKVKPDSATKCRYNGKTSISDFRIYNPRVNGSEATYYPDTNSTHRSMVYCSCDYHPTTMGEVIDKSGYFVKPRREDLKRRAAARRAEKEKTAYQMQDNAPKIKALEARLRAATEATAAAILTADPEALRTITNAAYFYLTTAAARMQDYKKAESEKRFNSAGAATHERDRIAEKLDAVEKALQEVKKNDC